MSTLLPLLEITGLTRRFGGLTAVDGLSLQVAPGEFVSVIGPNGAGKTTFFNLITGFERPDAGQVMFDGTDITGASPERLAARGVARTFQHGRVFPNLSVLDNVLVGAHTRLRSVRPRFGGAVAEMALALLRPTSVRAEEDTLRAEAVAILQRFGERLIPRLDQPTFGLSYANRRRVEIARALALRPRLLLLDEPTAGMNPTETREMQTIIAGLKAEGLTIVMIEHKLEMVMQLSDRVLVMDYGAAIAEGPPREVRANPAVIEAYLGRKAAS